MGKECREKESRPEAADSGPAPVPGARQVSSQPFQDKRAAWRLGMVSGVYFRMLCFGRNREESPSLSLVNRKQVLTDSHLIYLIGQEG